MLSRVITPARIGPYEVLGELGRGGMGAVYRARDTRRGVEVALKVVASALGDDSRFGDRFLQEARAVTALQHPGIVRVLDVGADEATGTAYLAMALLPGGSLKQRLRERGPLPQDEAARLAIQVADA